jgi:hypothetical protein
MIKNRTETIQSLIYQTVEESKRSRAEIAEDCGDLYSHFSRKINPNDPVRFPAEQIVPPIRSTRDSRILYFIVRQTSDITGLVLVKDRPRKVLFDPAEYAEHSVLIADYQRALSKWIEKKAETDEVIKRIDELRGELLAVRKAVLTKNRQKELFQP